MNKDIDKFYKKKREVMTHVNNLLEGDKNEYTKEEKEIAKRLGAIDYKAQEKLANEAYENRDVVTLRLKLKASRKAAKRRVIFARAIATSAVAAAVVLVSFLIRDSKKDELMVADNTIVNFSNFTEPTLVIDEKDVIKLDKEESKVFAQEVEERDITPNKMEKTIPAIQRVVIPKGFTYTVVLSDSTEVTLNAQSELIYPTQFGDTERRVTINGEGYFRVKKGANPFIVECGDVNIRVYGTEFNVKKQSEGVVESVLIEGSIGITRDGVEGVTMLKPNEIAIVDGTTKGITIKEVNIFNYTQWMEGNFNYVDCTLKNILNDIALWYGVDFSFDSSIEPESVILSFFSQKDKDLNEVLNVIELISNYTFIREGGSEYKVEKK